MIAFETWEHEERYLVRHLPVSIVPFVAAAALAALEQPRRSRVA